MTERICSVGGCGKPHVARGYCRNHYTNWNRTGNPIAVRIYVKGNRGCDFPACPKPHNAQGLCVGHTAQRTAGRDLTPLGEYRSTLVRDEQGRKQCRGCDGWFPVDRYAAESKTKDGLRAICDRCERGRKMRSMYGITLDEYLRLLDEQGGVCAVCRRVNEDGRELAVDHDHGCCSGRKACGKCVRGLLCSPCNLALGLLREAPEILDAAAAYLRKGVRAGAV